MCQNCLHSKVDFNQLHTLFKFLLAIWFQTCDKSRHWFSKPGPRGLCVSLSVAVHPESEPCVYHLTVKTQITLVPCYCAVKQKHHCTAPLPGGNPRHLPREFLFPTPLLTFTRGLSEIWLTTTWSLSGWMATVMFIIPARALCGEPSGVWRESRTFCCNGFIKRGQRRSCCLHACGGPTGWDRPVTSYGDRQPVPISHGGGSLGPSLRGPETARVGTGMMECLC